MHTQYSDDDTEPDNVDTRVPHGDPDLALIAAELRLRKLLADMQRIKHDPHVTLAIAEVDQRVAEISARYVRRTRQAVAARPHRPARVVRHVVRCRVVRHRAPVRSVAVRSAASTTSKPGATGDPDGEPPAPKSEPFSFGSDLPGGSL